MRVRFAAVAVAAVAVSLPVTTAIGGPAHAVGRAAPTATATATEVVRPVTAGRQVSAGFHVHRVSASVQCGYPSASPVSVSRNVEFCSPSAAYAIACWKAAAPKHVLCLPDPARHRLIRFRTGKFASTKPVSQRVLSPMLLVLADGTRCLIRDGGAWGALQGHPHLYGTYSCSRHGVVWARAKAAHSGVNETESTWTVRTAGFGHGHLVTRRVAQADFVGTFTG